jgi:Flp pilus assembly protein TadG
MIRQILKLGRDDRGVTSVLVALGLAVLIGFTGLGVETGLWYAIKRYDQSASDVAAISGAMELAGGQAYSDICGRAANGATANGFTLAAAWSCPAQSPASTNTCTSLTSGEMCVDNPPLFGAYVGQQKYVEVILARQQSTFFSLPWLPNVMVDTRAVAGLKSFPTCMLALNTTGTDLQNNGNATINLNNCSFSSNSTGTKNPNYSVDFSGNVTMTAAAISTAGGAKISGAANSISPPVTTGASPVPDPYAGQITYTLPAQTGPCTTGGTTLSPGVYGGGTGCKGNTAPMNFSGGTTTLCSGIYYLNGDDNQGEAFVISGSGTVVNMGTPGQTYAGVTCPTTQNGNTIPFGVTIIATCSGNGCSSGGAFVIGGTGSNTPTVNLSAPTTANPGGCAQPAGACIPKEVLFYQPAATADTKKASSVIAGGAGVSLDGVVYTPATQITLQGNPTLGSCTELIAGDFVVGGTPTMNNPALSCGINTESVTTLVLAE